MVLLNGSPISEANTDGVNVGTVISNNGESIKVMSKDDALELLLVISFIVENFKDAE